MTVFNFTNITNANSTLQVLQGVNNTLVGGNFWILVIVAIAFVILINLTFYRFKGALTAMSFTVSIISGLFFLAGLVPFYVAIIGLVQLVVMLMVSFFVGGGE